MILIFIAYAVLAITFTIGKMLLQLIDPILLIGIRMTCAGIILLAINFICSKTISIKKSDVCLIGLLSFIHISIPYISEFVALQSINPSCASFMFNLSPFFSAFFSYLYLNECMTFKKWLGLGLSMIAMVLFLEPSSDKVLCLGSMMPYGLMLICVGTCALAWIYFRMLVSTGRYSPMLINGWAMFFGGLQALIASWFLEPQAAIPWDNLQEFLLLLSATILIANMLFYNLYGYLLKKYTATLLAFVGFVTPAFVALYDWLFLGIAVNLGFVASMILIGFGIYIFYQEELRQGYVVVKN